MLDLNRTAETGDLAVGAGARPRLAVGALLRGWWVTSRMEYLPDALVHVALPLLLVLRQHTLSVQLTKLSLAGLAVWLLGHWVGSSLNCLADYDVDRLDAGHKARLAEAIDRAGVRPILVINLAEIAAATLASFWLAYRFGKPLLVFFWLAGLAVAYLYSFEPFRLKRRNFLNPLALAVIVYATPLFFVYHLIAPAWDAFDVTLLVVYCFQMVPMFLADELSDHDEDKAGGVNNPCVVYGRVAACRLAIAVYALSCAASLLLFAAQPVTRNLTGVFFFLLSVVIYLWVIREFVRLDRVSRAIEAAGSAAEREGLTRELKAFSRTPAWLVATSVGVILLVAPLVYLSRASL
jgi:1,4-dihydroxy-2-naphthoate octaprenyltransferase